jgi:hypothetical protein
VTRHGLVRGITDIDDDDREIALRTDQRHTNFARVGCVRLHLRALSLDTTIRSQRIRALSRGQYSRWRRLGVGIAS